MIFIVILFECCLSFTRINGIGELDDDQFGTELKNLLNFDNDDALFSKLFKDNLNQQNSAKNSFYCEEENEQKPKTKSFKRIKLEEEMFGEEMKPFAERNQRIKSARLTEIYDRKSQKNSIHSKSQKAIKIKLKHEQEDFHLSSKERYDSEVLQNESEDHSSSPHEDFDDSQNQSNNESDQTLNSSLHDDHDQQNCSPEGEYYMNQTERGQKLDYRGKERKIMLIDKFYELKKEYKIKNKYDVKKDSKIESEISKKLGVGGRWKIYKWKKELGQPRKKIKEETDEETKSKLVNAFSLIKSECQCKGYYDEIKRSKIENRIAKKLGTNRWSIYRWRKELGCSRKKFSNEEKYEIIDKFDRLKKAISSKFKVQLIKKVEDKVAQKFGVKAGTIYGWKQQLGISRNFKRDYSKADRLKIMHQYDRMRRKNPMLKCEKIAEVLEINARTIRKWKAQLEKDL